MKSIFTGLLLIFLDFTVTLGNSHIGLIPDFIGYIIMINGLVELAGESPLFLKVKPYATGMAVYTGIVYFMDLLGISAVLGALSFILAIASTVISLYISYNIVMGIKEMEKKHSVFLNGDSLKSTWIILSIFNVIVYIALLIPMLAAVCILVSLIVAICFLVAFSKSKNLYYAMNARANYSGEEDGD